MSAATTVVNLLQTKIDSTKDNMACAVFLDLRKASETIPHSKLLEKLNRYGIRGNVNNLLRDYLHMRHQYVDLHEEYSETIDNENPFALPQGSNLGPLLFLIYINNILDLKLNGILILFAELILAPIGGAHRSKSVRTQ